MRYTIGDVARTLGLTPGALHFFEREGVIAPKKGGGTRRTYDVEDVVRLMGCRKYRGMELSLKEIARQFSPRGDSCDEIGRKLLEQRESVLETARRYARLARDIQWFADAIAASQGKRGLVEEGEMPPCYALILSENGLISRDRDEQKRAAAWIEHMPASRVSSFAEADGTVRFGLSMDVEACEALGFHHMPGVRRIPPSPALHAYLFLPNDYYLDPAMAYEPLRNALGARAQGGTAIAVNLCAQCRGDRRDTLLEAWMPYSEKGNKEIQKST